MTLPSEKPRDSADLAAAAPARPRPARSAVRVAGRANV